MKSLFDQTDTSEILDRVEHLKPTARRLWGKMKVAQMLAHCSAVLQMANGEKILPRTSLGRIFGWMGRAQYSNEKPFARNIPTENQSKIVDERDFEMEKQKLVVFIKSFIRMAKMGQPGTPTLFWDN